MHKGYELFTETFIINAALIDAEFIYICFVHASTSM